MTTTTTWQVSQTDYDIATGFIFCAHWQCNAVDGGYTASIYSTCSWPQGTPQIPYDQLTQETVLGWVWESVDKEATEASLVAQIELQKNPVTATGTPWATT
jgi:hypothetical protein